MKNKFIIAGRLGGVVIFVLFLLGFESNYTVSKEAPFNYSTVGDPRFNYTISGEIRGLNDDSVIIFIQRQGSQGKMPKVDTSVCKAEHNTFHMQGNVDGARIASARLGGIRSRKSFTLFVEKGSIQIKGNIDSTDDIKATGTPNNNLYSAQNEWEKKIYSQIKMSGQQLNKLDTADKQAYNQLSDQIEGLRDSIKNNRIRFIEKYPNSLAGGIYLYVLSDKIPLAQLERLYDAIGSEVKNSGYGMIIRQYMEGGIRTEIGKTAPAFTSADTSGKAVPLSSFRGEYVLLDFWASWCVPCRAESPYLTAAYKKYKDKGFTIVSISLDNDPSKWKAAIRKDGLDWTHLSDLNAFDNPVAKLYGVQPIPDNFLIDPEGKIIARELRGEEIEKKLSGLFK